MSIRLVDSEWIGHEGIDVLPNEGAQHDRSALVYEHATRPGQYGVTLYSWSMDPVLGTEWLGVGYTRDSAITSASKFVRSGKVDAAKKLLVECEV